jgi:hypothetical protein
VAVFHVPLEWPRSGTHVTLSALEAVAEDEAAAALCQQVAQEVRAWATRLRDLSSGANINH